MSFTFDEKDLKQNTTEEHLPGGYNYAGPGTYYHARQKGNDYYKALMDKLGKPYSGTEPYDKPINKLDAAAMAHDKAFDDKTLSVKEIRASDEKLMEAAKSIDADDGFNEFAMAQAALVGFALKGVGESLAFLPRGWFSESQESGWDQAGHFADNILGLFSMSSEKEMVVGAMSLLEGFLAHLGEKAVNTTEKHPLLMTPFWALAGFLAYELKLKFPAIDIVAKLNARLNTWRETIPGVNRLFPDEVDIRPFVERQFPKLHDALERLAGRPVNAGDLSVEEQNIELTNMSFDDAAASGIVNSGNASDELNDIMERFQTGDDIAEPDGEFVESPPGNVDAPVRDDEWDDWDDEAPPPGNVDAPVEDDEWDDWDDEEPGVEEVNDMAPLWEDNERAVKNGLPESLLNEWSERNYPQMQNESAGGANVEDLPDVNLNYDEWDANPVLGDAPVVGTTIEASEPVGVPSFDAAGAGAGVGLMGLQIGSDLLVDNIAGFDANTNKEERFAVESGVGGAVQAGAVGALTELSAAEVFPPLTAGVFAGKEVGSRVADMTTSALQDAGVDEDTSKVVGGGTGGAAGGLAFAGAGAAAAVMTGAEMGSIAGPVGFAVGAAVGALGGTVAALLSLGDDDPEPQLVDEMEEKAKKEAEKSKAIFQDPKSTQAEKYDAQNDMLRYLKRYHEDRLDPDIGFDDNDVPFSKSKRQEYMDDMQNYDNYRKKIKEDPSSYQDKKELRRIERKYNPDAKLPNIVGGPTYEQQAQIAQLQKARSEEQLETNFPKLREEAIADIDANIKKIRDSIVYEPDPEPEPGELEGEGQAPTMLSVWQKEMGIDLYPKTPANLAELGAQQATATGIDLYPKTPANLVESVGTQATTTSNTLGDSAANPSAATPELIRFLLQNGRIDKLIYLKTPQRTFPTLEGLVRY